VGEAFDKAGKLMGLGYPGGPQISKLAENGNPLKFSFPDSQTKNYDFSFSGIKTSLLYFLRDNQLADPDFLSKNVNDICASYEYSLVKMLIKRLEKALKDLNPKSIGIVGGVSANKALRTALNDLATKHNTTSYIPQFQYCTDNAAMIAITAHYKYINQAFEPMSTSAHARSNW
jgi:N6-L-threonylcarbamoyladenine synthase